MSILTIPNIFDAVPVGEGDGHDLLKEEDIVWDLFEEVDDE